MTTNQSACLYKILSNGLFQTALVRYSEFPAALFAAAGQNFAAIFRLHAFTKTVFVFAGAVGWLVRTFHRLA